MNKVVKGGKTPSAVKKSKVEELNDFRAEMDQSVLKLDDALLKEIADLGLVPRWINATKYKAGGNFHKNNWKPYKVSNASGTSDRGSYDFGYGVSPEGYIIRNDLILAVKPLEQQRRHKSFIKQRADAMAGKSKNTIQEFKEKARAGGAVTLEGYEENNTDE